MDATCLAHTSNSLSFESTQFSSALTAFCIIFSFINEIRYSLASERPELLSSNKPSFSYKRILSDISGRIFRIALFSAVLAATARYRIAISYLY